MTAIAMMLDRQAQPAATPTPSIAKGVFAKLVEDQAAAPPAQPAAPAPEILALLQAIPKTELPRGGIPEAIATEVSVVMDLGVEQPLELELGPAGAPPTPLSALEQAIVHDLLGELPKAPKPSIFSPVAEPPPLPRLVRATSDLQPIESEISDGVPVAVERAPRPTRKGSAPDLIGDANLTALQQQVVPPPVRELMHARTLLAIPTSFVERAAPAPVAPTVAAVPALEHAHAAVVASPPVAMPALTPLEQAVQSLIAEIADRDEPSAPKLEVEQPPPAIALTDAPRLAIDATKAVAPVAGPREIAPQPENPNPSHVHLVIDDGMERVVVTVAVRGSDVNVAMRGSDDATTAALARNAGSLDHAMRARGLDLQSFVADHHDERRETQRERQEARRDRRPQDLFSIEELT